MDLNDATGQTRWIASEGNVDEFGTQMEVSF